jgi:hypothetical protein
MREALGHWLLHFFYEELLSPSRRIFVVDSHNDDIMFCPNCGSDEKQPNQFCRACGTNLNPVRTAIAMPDSVTASAAGAREEIGRAIAAKIRDMHTGKDLAKVAEDALPEIEKFLESPDEKRLRRLRTGTTISSIGIGVALAFAFVAIATKNEELLFLAGLGGVTFFLGLGFVINAVLFTLPRKTLVNRSQDADTQRALDAQHRDLQLPDGPEGLRGFSSVTEHTTQHLDAKTQER